MFILKNNKPWIEAKALFIPEFNELWLRDHTAKKARAMKELAYVYFIADFNSEYNIYGVEKVNVIGKEIMGKDGYKPDKAIKAAIARYEDIQNTYSMRYLKSIRDSTDSMIKYYDDLRYKSGKDDVNKYNPTLAMTSLKNLETVIEKLEKWEKKVRGEEDTMQIRGGGKVGMFEDTDTASWLIKQ